MSYYLVYVLELPLGLLGPRERQQVLDYLRGPERLVVDLPELVLYVVELFVPRGVHQYLAEAHDAHEGVIELVRYSGDELSKAGELL